MEECVISTITVSTCEGATTKATVVATVSTTFAHVHRICSCSFSAIQSSGNSCCKISWFLLTFGLCLEAFALMKPSQCLLSFLVTMIPSFLNMTSSYSQRKASIPIVPATHRLTLIEKQKYDAEPMPLFSSWETLLEELAAQNRSCDFSR